MPIGSVNNNILQQNPYVNRTAFAQRATVDDKTESASKKEPGVESEINKLTSDIEKEERKLSELQKEMVQHISNGEKDQAALKSVEIQQKQMSVTLMNAKIKELSSSKTEQSSSLRMPRDEYIPSSGKPNGIPSIYRFDRPTSPEKSKQAATSKKKEPDIASPEVEPKQSEPEDKAHVPEKNDDKKEGMQCTVNTDKVGREISLFQTHPMV